MITQFQFLQEKPWQLLANILHSNQKRYSIKRSVLKYLIATFAFISIAFDINAQSISISGYTIDGESLEELSSVHIYLQKHIGTASDLNGKFYLQVNYLDTLHLTRIGYDSLFIIISERESDQSFFISMKKSFKMLDNVDIQAMYKSKTILQIPNQPIYQLPGYDYSNQSAGDYHLGLAALASPITAIYRLFSKRFKEEKKNYVIIKERKVVDALFMQASENLSKVFAMSEIYVDEYFYREFILHSGLTTRFVAESTEYELLIILPQAIKAYFNYLEELK